MLYWAARECLSYLDKLYLARDAEVRNVVAVGGGMGFLHHLGSGAQSLFVLDSNPEQCAYIETILAEFRTLDRDGFIGAQRARQAKENYKCCFTGHSLGPYTFNWHFYAYAFQTQETYAAAQAILLNKPVSVQALRMDAFDYGQLIPSAPAVLYVLASNASRAFYTKNDAIFERVSATCRGPARYLDWDRDCRFAEPVVRA